VRFFFLANKIPFSETLWAMDEWAAAKARYVKEGVSPSGHLPIVYLDGKAHSEHISSMRLVAGLAGLQAASSPKDAFAQDVVADAYVGWRAQWVQAHFEGDAEAKVAYKDSVADRLLEFEQLAKSHCTSDRFLSGDVPLWADSALFSLMSDNITTGYLTEDVLASSPRLYALYRAYRSVPEIEAWFNHADQPAPEIQFSVHDHLEILGAVSPTIIKLEYLALPHPVSARGGAVRFFFLANKIPFSETLWAMDEWAAAKARYVKEGVSPSGHLPIVYLDGKAHSEHISSMRLVAGLAGLQAASSPKDAFAQDVVADAYVGWRAQWVQAHFEGDAEAKVAYKDSVADRLLEFEQLAKSHCTSDRFLSGDVPLWADSALFSLMSDNITTGYLTEDVLASSPRLYALYRAYRSVPEIEAWFNHADQAAPTLLSAGMESHSRLSVLKAIGRAVGCLSKPEVGQ